MPSYCSAFNCTNKADKASDISFHSFPLNNPPLLKEWLVRIKRENFKPNRSSKICSEHFEIDCFIVEKFSGRKKLTSEAVPTRFSFKELKERPRNSYQLRYVNYSLVYLLFIYFFFNYNIHLY